MFNSSLSANPVSYKNFINENCKEFDFGFWKFSNNATGSSIFKLKLNCFLKHSITEPNSFSLSSVFSVIVSTKENKSNN